MSEIQITKLRVHAWLDTSRIAEALAELPLLHGVQAKVEGERGWHHMAEDGKPLLFKEVAEAEAWIDRNPPGPIPGRFASVGRTSFVSPSPGA